MKITILKALKALSASALLASCLCAQPGQMLTAKVPFDFTVGNQHFDAGAYTVSTGVAQSTILVRGEENGSARFVMTISTQADNVPERPKLVFNRYGDHYFLSQVWIGGTNLGRQLPLSKVEREIARNIKKPETVSLLASAGHIQVSGR